MSPWNCPSFPSSFSRLYNVLGALETDTIETCEELVEFYLKQNLIY